MKKNPKIIQRPPQHQRRQPGLEFKMKPLPQAEKFTYTGSGKLKDKVALITGGDSGIGRAAAIAFAKEGAHLVIDYLNEHADAHETKHQVEQENRNCLIIAGDIGEEKFCRQVVIGSDVPLKRAGEPAKVAPCFVFLASEDASYMTGQVLHPNGGEVING